MARGKGNTPAGVGDDAPFEVADERGPRFGLVYMLDWDTETCRNLSGAAVRVYVTLTMFAAAGVGERPRGYPKQRTIRKITGLARETVIRAVNELVGAKLVRKEPRGDQLLTYVLLPAPDRGA